MKNDPYSPPFISVVIPMHNAEATIESCLKSVLNSTYPDFEIVAVSDCSDDRTAEIAWNFQVKVILFDGDPYGPAYARNAGVNEANGEIILFIDSDVLIKPDTLIKVARTFEEHPQIDALFGSYDPEPGEGDFLSQFKNLSHHFVHQQSGEEGVTFWAGCGAIRKKVFLELEGFNANLYPQPSIEDIELGYRLHKKDRKIQVNHDIQVKHLKKWTLWGWIKTDVLNRAIPWTLLILSERSMPDKLNLETSQRISAMLIILYLLFLLIFTAYPFLVFFALFYFFSILLLSNSNIRGESKPIVMTLKENAVLYGLLLIFGAVVYLYDLWLLMVPLVLLFFTVLAGQFIDSSKKMFIQGVFSTIVLCLAVIFLILIFTISFYHGFITLAVIALIVFLNRRLFIFFIQRRGFMFAVASLPFQLLYYFYSFIAFGLGSIIYFWRRLMFN